MGTAQVSAGIGGSLKADLTVNLGETGTKVRLDEVPDLSTQGSISYAVYAYATWFDFTGTHTKHWTLAADTLAEF